MIKPRRVKKKTERTQIHKVTNKRGEIKITNERGGITTNTTDTQIIISDYYKKLYANQLGNLGKNGQIPIKTQTNSTERAIENLNKITASRDTE